MNDLTTTSTDDLPTISPLQDDYEYTREQLKNIFKESEEVLEHAGDIAKETGEPRAIDAFTNLAKTMGDLARGVMENSRSKAAMDNSRAKAQDVETNAPITQNNQTIFVGTTKELHDMLSKDSDVIDVQGVPNDE